MTDNWAMHEAETGLTPPNQNRAQWRDRGARIAQLETELEDARAEIGRLTPPDAPHVVRELQEAREAKWVDSVRDVVEVIGIEDTDYPDYRMIADEGMALAAEETFEATSALRQELAQAQAENERLRGERDHWFGEMEDHNELCSSMDEIAKDADDRAEAAEAREVSLRKAIEALALSLDRGDSIDRGVAADLRALAADPTPAADRVANRVIARAKVEDHCTAHTEFNLSCVWCGMARDNLERATTTTPAAEAHAQDGA